STTTTSTLAPYYVCRSSMTKTQNVPTECYSKNEKEYYNSTMRSTVDYIINDTVVAEHAGNRVRIEGDTCHYISTKVSFTVGSFSSCVKPQGILYEEPGELVTP
ncbi:hypothetical protein ACFLRF_04250, partial [Candidatus Altiarchaeota archaeon]